MKSAWWDGDYGVGQGWGVTDYAGEPAGHGAAHWHAGIDISVPGGTAIHYPNGMPPTKVIAASWDDGYGNCVKVQVGDHMVVLGHNKSLVVSTGQAIKGGDTLSYSDSTGNSTGNHMHFEVRPMGGAYGSDVDPTPFLTPDGSQVGQGSSNAGAPAGLDVGSALAGVGTSINLAFQKAALAGQVAAGLAVIVAGTVVILLSTRATAAPTRAVLPGPLSPPSQRRRTAQRASGGSGETVTKYDVRAARRARGETVGQTADEIAVGSARGVRSERRLSRARYRQDARNIAARAAEHRASQNREVEDSPLAPYKRRVGANA